jgi:hypothetical protein
VPSSETAVATWHAKKKYGILSIRIIKMVLL